MDDLKSDSEDNFSDWEDDEDEVIVKSLFSDARLTSIEQFLIHDMEMFDFNLSEIVSSMKFDNVLLIMLINMIRRRVKEIGEPNVDASFIRLLKEDIHRENLLRDDINMIPIFQDDPVLFLLWDELLKNGAVADDEDDDDDMQASNLGEPTADASEMRDTITKYRNLVASLAANPDVADDSYYFDSYSNVAIHETMLRDGPRTSAYRDALIENSTFMKGKVVLDVGCGTGILCMLAVRAGARKVIGVDNSSIIEKARKIIERNGMSDKITLVKGRLEDVKLPLIDEEVDVIVSEWMGYGLYFENMLSSIIYARDTYLSSNGVLMPSHANIYIEAMTAIGEVDRVAWWGDVYGFDMTDMAELVSREAQVQLADNEDVISDRVLAHSLDIHKAADADLDFTAPFTMVRQRVSINDAPRQYSHVCFSIPDDILI